MGKYAQVVMGPAGSGKSTYCRSIQDHYAEQKRSVHIVNLDPAVEHLGYEPSLDIRDLISLEDATSQMQFGPNGGLVFCMEYLADNIDWLEEQIADFADDYLIIDCPGQIELYTHIPAVKKILSYFQGWGYRVVGLYMLDAQFISDPGKFIAAAMMCLSAMLQLEVPHLNILTKMDLVGPQTQKVIDSFVETDAAMLLASLNHGTPTRLHQLNSAFCSLLQDYNLVGFLTLSSRDRDSMDMLQAQCEHIMQVDEDDEPKDPGDGGMDDGQTVGDAGDVFGKLG